MNTTAPQDERVSELARRIEELETRDEAAFGHFTRWDWGVCVAFAILVPLLLMWRCAA